MKNVLIVTLFLGLLSFSCSDTTSTNEFEQISLPLKVGNSWTFDVVRTDYQRDPISVTELPPVTFNVVSDTLIGEARWFYIESDDRQMNEFKAGYYSNQEGGIYFVRKSIFDSGLEKESYSTLMFTKDINHPSLSENSTPSLTPFIHNPDSRVPERLIKNQSVIASVTYKGESINQEFNDITQNYVWNYYQQFTWNRVYAINPFDLNYSISNELGFTVFEQAYVSNKGSTEDDPRLQPLMIFRFELKEFKDN